MDRDSTLRVEKTTSLKAVVKKTYVLDTNVLLHDPTAVAAFKQHHVVIPMTVLEELDHIKDRRDKTVSREARIAIQMIDKVVDNASPQDIQAGVPVPVPKSAAYANIDDKDYVDCVSIGKLSSFIDFYNYVPLYF